MNNLFHVKRIVEMWMKFVGNLSSTWNQERKYV